MTADPMNIKAKVERLYIRRQFFTVRVRGDWNRITADGKRKPNAISFITAYAKLEGEQHTPP
jgi:hypothetical protein